MSSFAALRAQRNARHGVSAVKAMRSSAPPPAEPSSTASIQSSPSPSTPTSAIGMAEPEPPRGTQQASEETQRGSQLEADLALHQQAGRDESDNDLFASELAGTPLEIRRTPGHGRGMYATRSVSAGTTLLRTRPLAAVLSTAHLSTHCSACYSSPAKLSRCASCKAVHYCSAACQKADWPTHKPECASLTRLRRMWAATYPDRARRGEAGFVPPEALRAMGRLCWARRDRTVTPARWSQVAGMESHAARDEGERLANQVTHLRHYLGAGAGSGDLVYPADMGAFGFSGAKELLDLASSFAVNSFTLSTPDLNPIGAATSPLCALFNHSCQPNAVVVFPRKGGEMVVVAIADIAPGDEVLTAYIDVSLPYADRRADLSERYGFECDCSLCSLGPGWADPRWSIRHDSCGRLAPMPDLASPEAHVECSCGMGFEVDTGSLRCLIEAGRKLLSEDESGVLDHTTALQTLSTLIPSLAAHLPPSAHPLLHLLRLHALLLTPPSTPVERATAISHLTLAAAGARAAYSSNHPFVGVLLAERAKLMAMEEPLASALSQGQGEGQGRVMLDEAGMKSKRAELVTTVAALEEAVRACKIGFGGGEVAAEMRALAGEVGRELDMLRWRPGG